MLSIHRFASAFAAALTAALSPAALAQEGAPAADAPAKIEAKAEAKVEFVVLRTSMGDILLELNAEKAPTSVANFTTYVKEGFYDGTVFHRVIPNFMVQGGGFTADGTQKPTKAGIKNEWKNGLSNARGTIAMARLGGRPDSATAQFFINHKDNAFLDQPRDGAGYAVFGSVASGMEVVDAIAAVSCTTKQGMQNWPVADVIIKKAEVLDKDAAAKMKGGAKKADAPKSDAPATPAAPAAPAAPAKPE